MLQVSCANRFRLLLSIKRFHPVDRAITKTVRGQATAQRTLNKGEVCTSQLPFSSLKLVLKS